MSTLSTAGSPPAPVSGVKRRGRCIGGEGLGRDASRDARRLAAAVLEVLAGARTPAEAATALGLSLPRYYQVEQQALRGLTAACEPRPRGRQVRPDQEAAKLRRENARLRREVLRQQALVRAVQRSVGLAPPAPPPNKAAGKKRRRHQARGLAMAARLRAGVAGELGPGSSNDGGQSGEKREGSSNGRPYTHLWPPPAFAKRLARRP
jgi:hypothetical protein